MTMMIVLIGLVFLSLGLNFYYRFRVMKELRSSNIHREVDISFRKIMNKGARQELIGRHPKHRASIERLHTYMLRSFLSGAVILLLIILVLALQYI